jgi:hypothetical protein
MVQLFGGEVPGQLSQQIVDVLHDSLQQSINQSVISVLWLKFQFSTSEVVLWDVLLKIINWKHLLEPSVFRIRMIYNII